MNTHGNFYFLLQSVVFLSTSISYYVSFNGRQKDFSRIPLVSYSFILFIFSCGLLLLLLLLFYNLILMMNFFCLFYKIFLFLFFCYLKKYSSISFLHHFFSCSCLLVINNPPLPYVLNKIEHKNKKISSRHANKTTIWLSEWMECRKRMIFWHSELLLCRHMKKTSLFSCLFYLVPMN